MEELIKETIEQLERISKNIASVIDDGVDYTGIAIDALEKHIPKKPDFEGDGYAPDGTFVYDTWICPNCGKHYEIVIDDYKYCPECGQAIDWKE